jgi:hypothetical protein
MDYKEIPATTSYEEKNQQKHLGQRRPVNWQDTIGKTIMSKDNLDMGKVIVDPDTDYNTSYLISIEYGDHERFRIPKETIYKIEKDSVYTTLTENEILETRKNDPFWTSMGSYTGHTGHEE